MNNETNEAAEYPPVRPEIMAEIVAVDCHLADLILKAQGNARELDELVGMLDAHLASCEFDRDSLLLGVPDRCPSPALPTITDLPAGEQRLIFEAALFGAVGLETLRLLTHADVQFLINKLSQGVNIIASEMTEQQITEALHKHLKMHNENLVKQVFHSKIQSENTQKKTSG
jgi:hypothetical protein